MDPKHDRQKLSRNASFLAKPGNGRIKNPFVRIVGLLAVFMISLGVAWGAKFYIQTKASLDATYQGSGKTSVAIGQQKPVSVLLLGTDTGIENRGNEGGNSDTMILATANPQKQQATLTSIPRDILADIKGANQFYMAKINSAYNVGASKSSMATISTLLNVPIDYYVEINMQAMEKLVDAVGGVDVNVPFAFTYNTTFHKGQMHLNGKQALDYARMRKEDPKGDYGRQKRQRQIIQAILSKSTSIDTIQNYQKILKVVEKYIKTNLTFNDMISLAMNYRGATKDLKSTYIQGHDAWIGGSAYQVASTKELQKHSDSIRASLGLNAQTLNNQETRQNRLNSGLNWKNPAAFQNYIIYDKNTNTPWNGPTN